MDYYGNDNGNQNGGYSHDPFASEMALLSRLRLSGAKL